MSFQLSSNLAPVPNSVAMLNTVLAKSYNNSSEVSSKPSDKAAAVVILAVLVIVSSE
jgi:hypothetical protein